MVDQWSYLRFIMKGIFTLFFWNWLLHASAIQKEGCTSPQYLQLGRTGTIQCFFRQGFFGVVWFNSTDIEQHPILVMKESIKSGTGYLSGEFDVYWNGSLRVNHVLLKHESAFTVLKFNSNDGDPDLHVVRVRTFVEPVFPYPLVSDCRNTSEVCLLPTNKNSPLNCSILQARPAINLTWVVRTVVEDKDISSQVTVFTNGVVYSSYVTPRNSFQFTKNVALLVCKADGPTEVINQTEKQVMLLNSEIDFSSVAPKLLHFQQGTKMTLKCVENGKNFPFIVWMRLRDGAHEYLIYSISFGEQYTKTYVDDFDIGDNGSLHVSQTTIPQEGIYYCIFGNGVIDGVVAYEVSVYVSPHPPNPVIDGCREQQYCVLEIQSDDNITCSLNGVRPDLGLEWKILYGDKHSSISFSNDRLVVKESGHTMNVKLTSEIHCVSGSNDRFTVECKASGQNAILFDLSTKFDLRCVNGNPSEGPNLQKQTYLIVIIVVTALIIGTIIIIGIFRIKVKRKNLHHLEHSRDGNEDVVIPLSTDLENIIEKKDDDLRIVVIGKIGVGKSATANSILGEKIFVEDLNTMPTTISVSCATQNVNGRKISVVDTPGLDDPDRKTEDIVRDVAMIFSNGVHAFLYVLNAASPRFDKKELDTIRNFENILEGKMKNYRLLVYSHADSMEQDMDLNAYCNEQQKGEEAISSFFKEFVDKVVAVNNSSSSIVERKTNQTVIVSLIDLMREKNRSSFYMHDVFTKAVTK